MDVCSVRARRAGTRTTTTTEPADTEVEYNSFADVRADPAKPWSPSAAAIKDVFLLSRASQQVLLLGLSQKTLLDAARRAQDDGTVYSIAPDTRQRRAVFVALVVSAGKPREIEYELSVR